ncbi:MAG TPA: ATP-binding cassette domain-containing protein [Jatrophihabitans sp.]|uniref:ABC transporter ATP-binding protein n=1 Tax=Jatrophihabitans sp. TaxID=1932789 RepID=UPI002E02FB58|nr:ATP-binding cassette domain-containing protein [Jatrophihabitans sp.]
MSAFVTAEPAADPAVPTAPVALRTAALTRSFGTQVAVDAVDLVVPRGAVYGFLGPNGSGKTTTIRVLLGLIAADSGEVEMLGHAMPRAAAQVLPRVGALIEGPAFHPYITGEQNLRRLDRSDATADPATSPERITAALARVGLTAAAGKKYRNYSLGMKQRLGLAAALLQPRELLILDEPTNGLDPQGTREVRKLIRELATDGTTVLVSSHLLSEIEQVATHVGMMSGGRLVRQGTLAEVLADGLPSIRVHTPDVEPAAVTMRGLGLDPVTHDDAITARLTSVAVEDVAAALVRAGVRLQGLAVERPDLEELFVSITGEGFDVLR